MREEQSSPQVQHFPETCKIGRVGNSHLKCKINFVPQNLVPTYCKIDSHLKCEINFVPLSDSHLKCKRNIVPHASILQIPRVPEGKPAIWNPMVCAIYKCPEDTVQPTYPYRTTSYSIVIVSSMFHPKPAARPHRKCAACSSGDKAVGGRS